MSISISTWLCLLAAQLLPWLMGSLIVWRLLGLSRRGAVPLMLGLGGAAGPPIATASLWLLDFLGRPLTMGNSFAAVLLLGCALFGASHLLGRWSGRSSWQEVQDSVATDLDAHKFARIAVWVIMALVALRALMLLPDVTQRPLFPWDAWKVWAWKARVWFDVGALLPFQSSSSWASAETDQYVIDGVNHPHFVSLVMLWSALAVGEWNDRLIGLPWMLAGVWSCLLTWGVLRYVGLPRLLCWVGVYLLVSLPLLNAHIALFGYADLWSMLYFLVFCVGFLMWAHEPRWRHASIMVLSAFVLILTKDTGVYWIPALVLSVVLTRLPDRFLLQVAGVGLVLSGLAFWLDIDPVSILSSGRYRVSSQPIPEVLLGIAQHMLVWLDWHLLWYAMPFIFVFAFRLRVHSDVLRSLLLLSAILLLTAVAGFVGTRAGEYAIIGTLFGRVLLAIVPAFVLLSVLTLWEGYRQQRVFNHSKIAATE